MGELLGSLKIISIIIISSSNSNNKNSYYNNYWSGISFVF